MKVREIVLCALFIALVAVGAFIRIPVGTDVYTLQFLFTLLAGVLLGARLGAVAVRPMRVGARPAAARRAAVTPGTRSSTRTS